MTDTDRQLVREAVKSTSASRMLITHSTDTARVRVGVEGKTVVMTGAMKG